MSAPGFTLNGQPCIDSRWLYESAIEKDLPTSHWAGLANSFRMVRGKYPSRGYVLVPQSACGAGKAVDPNALATLVLTDGTATVTVNKLLILNCSCVYADNPTVASGTMPYLVELADLRILGRHTGGSTANGSKAPVCMNLDDMGANVNPQTPMRLYMDTMNAGAEWTWATMLQQIWNDGLTPLGAYPGAGALDEVAGQTYPPRNYLFPGGTHWDIFNRILQDLGGIIAPTLAGGFQILNAHATDPYNTAGLFTALASKIEHPSIDFYGTLHRIPATVRVYFPTNDFAYQNSTNKDWETPEEYWRNFKHSTYVDVPTATIIPAATTIPGTVSQVWSGLLAKYNDQGIPQNTAQLNTVANQLATNLLNALNYSDGRLSNIYTGYQAFLPGQAVSGVAWFDLGPNPGPRTEVTTVPRDDLNPVTSIGSGSGSGVIREVGTPFGIQRGLRDELDFFSRETNGPPNVARMQALQGLGFRHAIGKLITPLTATNSAAALWRPVYGTNGNPPTFQEVTGSPFPNTTLLRCWAFPNFGFNANPGDMVHLIWFPQVQEWFVLDRKAITPVFISIGVRFGTLLTDNAVTQLTNALFNPATVRSGNPVYWGSGNIDLEDFSYMPDGTVRINKDGIYAVSMNFGFIFLGTPKFDAARVSGWIIHTVLRADNVNYLRSFGPPVGGPPNVQNNVRIAYSFHRQEQLDFTILTYLQGSGIGRDVVTGAPALDQAGNQISTTIANVSIKPSFDHYNYGYTYGSFHDYQLAWLSSGSFIRLEARLNSDFGFWAGAGSPSFNSFGLDGLNDFGIITLNRIANNQGKQT